MFFANQTRKSSDNPAIVRRRKLEDKRAVIESVVKNNETVGRMATWEQKTDKIIRKNTVMNLARSLQRGEESQLQARKNRLRDLLARDDEVYRSELAGLQETSQMKARRMVSVARALKQEREEKRKAQAQEMFNKQWREGCDDLRLIESEKFQQHCKTEVAKQLAEKSGAKQNAREEEMRWAKLMEDERLKKIEKEDQEAKARQAFNHETKMALMNQMDSRRAAKEAAAADQEEERMLLKQAMEEELAFDKVRTLKRNEEQKTQLQRIKDFNESTMHAKRQVEEMHRKQEMRDLAEKMEAHANELHLKDADKQQLRDDMKHYSHFLQERKAEEKQMERELEVLCQEEMERANAKRDMQWMKERLKREQLLANVYQGRQQQIVEKDKEARRREIEVAMERKAIERELEKARLNDDEEERQEARDAKERALDLDRQAEAHRSRKAIAATEARKEFEAAEQAEKVYSAFLKREYASMWNKKYEPKSFGLKEQKWN